MKFFQFFNLTDAEGNLSLSNLGVYVAYGIMAYGIAHGMTPEQLTAILTLFANYTVKRIITHKATVADQQKQIDELKAVPSAPVIDHTPDINELKAAVEALKAAATFRK